MIAAFETFKDPSPWKLGTFMSMSQYNLVLSRNPGPSAPKTNAIGPVGKLLIPSFMVFSANPSRPSITKPNDFSSSILLL